MSKNGHVVTPSQPAKALANQHRGLKAAPKNSARVRLDGNIARRAVRACEFFWWDTDLPGFGLRTFPGGAKSWFVQFRQRGKQKRVTLGRPGEMSAIDARKSEVYVPRVWAVIMPIVERTPEWLFQKLTFLSGR